MNSNSLEGRASKSRSCRRRTFCSIIRQRKNAVTIWQTDAQCVNSIRRFRAMNWGYKLLSLSNILVPISITAIIFVRQKHDWLHAWLPWLALFSWLVFAFDTLTYLRGYLAQRRGIRPEGLGKRPSSRADIGYIIVLMVLFGLLAIISILGKHRDWSVPLIFFAMLAGQCSSYARSRFWDAGQNEQLSPCPR